jgi:hypothetical protein
MAASAPSDAVVGAVAPGLGVGADKDRLCWPAEAGDGTNSLSWSLDMPPPRRVRVLAARAARGYCPAAACTAAMHILVAPSAAHAAPGPTLFAVVRWSPAAKGCHCAGKPFAQGSRRWPGLPVQAIDYADRSDTLP